MNVFRKANVFILFFFLFFLSSSRIYASVLYYSPLTNTDTFSSLWSVVPGDLAGSFDANGLHGRAHYHYNIGTQNVVLKATVDITQNSIVSFRCRENFERTTIEQAIYQDNATTGITEGINNNFYNITNYNLGSLIGLHTYELDCLDNKITTKLDGQENSGTVSPSYPSNTTYVGIYAGPGTTISNLVICDTTNCNYPTPTPTEEPTPTSSPTPTPSPTPTTIPTPTPTQIPTPTPFDNNHLTVPLIKQTSNPWQAIEYDSAHIWAPLNKTIHDWGCVITDIAMVFQFHNITKMPNNTPVNPTNINNWLKSQSDGYIANGLVNWLAISRLSLLAKNSGNNPGFSSADALQFSRADGDSEYNRSLLADDVRAIPDILEESGHFVVATGTQPNPNTFLINDPYFSRTLLTDGYNNSFISINRFIPTHTDLSYFLFVGPQDIDFHLETSTGNTVGQEFIQQPLQNPGDPSQTSGNPVKLFYFEQPANDSYTLTITNTSNQYHAQAYVYDMKGSVRSFSLEGTGTQNNPDTYAVRFSKTNIHQDTIKKHDIFDSLLADLDALKLHNEIKQNIYSLLLQNISRAKNDYDNHRIIQEKITLTKVLIILSWNKGNAITLHAYNVLTKDIFSLLSH